MAFGKRRLDSVRAAATGPGEPEVLGPVQRLEALHQDLERLFDTTCRIADAVRGETVVAVPVILDDKPDPEAGPLLLKGFYRHFARRDDDCVVHSMLAYRAPDAGSPTDPNAQFHLSQLTGRAMEFNMFCQRAELDQALGVALQAPSVPAMVDAILVPAAFFLGLLENMIAMASDAEANVAAPDLTEQKATIDRYLLMASDRMLDPRGLEGLRPAVAWPFVGIEIDIRPHDGDYFLNSVYFPAEHARVLLGEGQAATSAAA